MRKSKIILSLLIISLLTSKTWAVKAATSGTDENEINTKISTQADEQAGETDTTERSLVFTPTPSSTKLNEGEEITITLELSEIKMGQDGINTFGGKLEYDENVFEKVTSDDISSQNNWSIAYNDEETAKKEIKNIPNIIKIAEDWSLFLTNDLSGNLHGYNTINKYLIKDSDISKYAYKWATGIDITFISAHQLLSPTFTNQKTENYEIYSENAFSCEIYLEKNMKVNGKTMQDKMHERMYFVYDKENSGWKLVNMQSITENK